MPESMIAMPMPLPVGLPLVSPSVERSTVSAGAAGAAVVEGFAPNPVTGAFSDSVSVSSRSASWLRWSAVSLVESAFTEGCSLSMMSPWAFSHSRTAPIWPALARMMTGWTLALFVFTAASSARSSFRCEAVSFAANTPRGASAVRTVRRMTTVERRI